MNGLKWLRVKIRSRIWVQMSVEILLILLLSVSLFIAYFQGRYVNYLVEETTLTEEKLLDAVASSMNGVLEQAVYISGEIAIARDLKAAADEVIDCEDKEYTRKKLNLFSVLQDMALYSSSIRYISVANGTGVLSEYCRAWAGAKDYTLWKEENLPVLSSLFEKVLNNVKTHSNIKYEVLISDGYDSVDQNTLIHVAYPLMGEKRGYDQVNSMVIVSYNFADIIKRSTFLAAKNQDHVQVFLMDENRTILYHEATDMLGTTAPLYSGDQYVTLEHPLSFFGWKLAAVIHKGNIVAKVSSFYMKSLVWCVFLLIASCIAWQMVVRSVLKPVMIISAKMREGRKQHSHTMIEIEGENEFWKLAENYNDLMEELLRSEKRALKELEEKNHSLELQMKAQREALESQINAHFICNTLNAINYEVMDSGRMETAEMIKALSGMLSYTFSRNYGEVTIGTELRCVKQYLRLQKFRLMDLFDYEVDFPKEYYDWPCCKMVLQPIVENSITHGFETMESGGKIEIRGVVEKGNCFLTIRDNGEGMEEELKKEIRDCFSENRLLYVEHPGRGIGIANVLTRMKMFYGEGFRMNLESEIGKGTCFTFVLPLPFISEERKDLDEDFDC